jgi:hypothetical protein
MTDQATPTAPVVYRYTGTIATQSIAVEPPRFPDHDEPLGVGGPVMADPPVEQSIPQRTLGSIPPRDLTQADIDALTDFDREQLRISVERGDGLYTAPAAKPQTTQSQAPGAPAPSASTPAADAAPKTTAAAPPPAQT